MNESTVLNDLWLYFGGCLVGAVFAIDGLPPSVTLNKRHQAIDLLIAVFLLFWLFVPVFPFTEKAIGLPFCLVDEAGACGLLVLLAWTRARSYLTRK